MNTRVSAALRPSHPASFDVRQLIERLTRTDDSAVRFAQRVLLAAVMFPHGAQKLFGWFGGYGYSGTMNFFTNTMGLPSLLALLVIVAESVGAVLLFAGLFSRVAALGIAAVMIGAVLTTHLDVGFFMNWSGTLQGEGYEYHLLALALALPIVLLGGGRYALDTKLSRALRE